VGRYFIKKRGQSFYTTSEIIYSGMENFNCKNLNNLDVYEQIETNTIYDTISKIILNKEISEDI
jgi:hypothetical protein